MRPLPTTLPPHFSHGGSDSWPCPLIPRDGGGIALCIFERGFRGLWGGTADPGTSSRSAPFERSYVLSFSRTCYSLPSSYIVNPRKAGIAPF